MKKTVFLMTVSFLSFHLMSCSDFLNDFLEKPPTEDITIDDTFNSRELATKALVMCYINLPFGLPPSTANPTSATINLEVQKPRLGVGRGLLDQLTDLNTSVWTAVNGPTDFYYPGLYNASLEEETPGVVKYHFRYQMQWQAIRRCWTIIENIDRVPDMEQDEKEQYKAEARTIIAIHYVDMLRHFGGVPKVDHVYGADEDLHTSRMTIREMIDWIAGLIDAAYDKLPHRYADPNEYGRITRLGALAVKARMLHFAASPLFNDEEPYLSGEASDANYTWLGGKDRELWKEARDAAEQVITEALANGYGLVQPVTPNITGYRAAYRKAYHEPDNNESLLITRLPDFPVYQGPFQQQQFLAIFQYGSFNPTQNWADMFPMTNGYDIDPSMPNYHASNGYDNQLPNKDRDPRYYESVVTNNDEWGILSPGVARMWHGGAEKLLNRYCYHGIATRKFHLGGGSGGLTATGLPLVWPYVRLAEIYLNYAEAANQYDGSPSSLALQRVNDVRARVGLPGLPANMSKDDFHQAVLKERCCELGFEEIRWYDLIRWKMEDRFKVTLRGLKSWLWVDRAQISGGYSLDGVPEGTRDNAYGAAIPGLVNDDAAVWLTGDGVIGNVGTVYVRLPATAISNDPRPTANTNYDPGRHIITYHYYNFPETEIRAWAVNFSPKWYLSAFPIGEVNKNYGLVQNPGW
jgi:hypothetical protein